MAIGLKEIGRIAIASVTISACAHNGTPAMQARDHLFDEGADEDHIVCHTDPDYAKAVFGAHRKVPLDATIISAATRGNSEAVAKCIAYKR